MSKTPIEDDILFPALLRTKGVLLGGEYAWPPAVVREVIDFLLRKRVAVLGVEVWLPEGQYPRVLGSSNYEVTSAGNWDDYVSRNADAAIADIERRRLPENALLNLTWMTELQGKRLLR